MTPEEIKTKYEQRIIAILNSIRKELTQDDLLSCSYPDDMTCDDYRWSMYVQTPEQIEKQIEDEGVDISFLICESENWDGEENGVNFCIDIVGYGGEIIGGLHPFNYTEQVWVSRDNEEAIEERFSLMEQADCFVGVELVREYFNKKGANGKRTNS